MATNLTAVIKHLHRILAPPVSDRTDGELLAQFVATRDESCFAALVQRQGPMVFAVSQRMLHHHQDAEDCFQATFMVLARKAATVKHESVGSWLYAVAYRTALEARSVNDRRRNHEKQVEDLPHPEIMPAEANDWRPWLDQELNRLPECYRAAIVACDLEGQSRKEAARLLGLAEGTISSRLARGRRLLAKKLARRGFMLSVIALATMLGENAVSAQVPAALCLSTVQAAALVASGQLTAVSASSTILMKGVLKAMLLSKLKMMVGAVVVAVALGTSCLVYQASGQTAATTEKRGDAKPQSELDRLRRENELLKLNLEVVLEKVRAQEEELRALKSKPAAGKPAAFILDLDGKKVPMMLDFSQGKIRIEEKSAPKIEGKPAPKIEGKLEPKPGTNPKFEIKPTPKDEGKAIPLTIFVEGKSMTMKGLIQNVQKPGGRQELERTVDSLEKAVKELKEQLKKTKD
jgi:RNA polymerase sigma factor (sigma-70 family)